MSFVFEAGDLAVPFYSVHNHYSVIMSIVFRKGIAGNLLGLGHNHIEEVVPGPECITVKVKGEGDYRYLNPDLFYKEFFRIRRAKTFAVTIRFRDVCPPSITAVAYTTPQRRKYVLRVEADEIRCTCPDYHHQKGSVEIPMCKHVFAYLELFRVNTLEEYFELAKDFKTYDDVVERIAF